MIGQAVVGLMNEHGWSRFGLISEVHKDKVWILSRDGITEEADNNNLSISMSRKVGVGEEDSLEEVLRDVAKVSRSKSRPTMRRRSM